MNVKTCDLCGKILNNLNTVRDCSYKYTDSNSKSIFLKIGLRCEEFGIAQPDICSDCFAESLEILAKTFRNGEN